MRGWPPWAGRLPSPWKTASPAPINGSWNRNRFVPEGRIQDLSRFRLPPGFRGRSGGAVFLWQIVQASLFACSPQFAYGWRRLLLRAFGARIGRAVKVRPSVRITYPWKVEIGDRSWIGDHAELYSLAPI